MPLPDATTQAPEEWEIKADLGACPWCSNCGEELAGRGGILCTGCLSVLSGAHTADTSEALPEVALGPGCPECGWRVCSEHEVWNDGAPRHADGQRWSFDELTEAITEGRQTATFLGKRT